jgi:hypothetical protein
MDSREQQVLTGLSSGRPGRTSGVRLADALVQRMPIAVQSAFTRSGRVAERVEYLLDVVIEDSFVLHGRGLGFPIVLPRAATRARLCLRSQIRLLPPVVAEMLLSLGQVCPSRQMPVGNPTAAIDEMLGFRSSSPMTRRSASSVVRPSSPISSESRAGTNSGTTQRQRGGREAVCRSTSR